MSIYSYRLNKPHHHLCTNMNAQTSICDYGTVKMFIPLHGGVLPLPTKEFYFRRQTQLSHPEPSEKGKRNVPF